MLCFLAEVHVLTLQLASPLPLLRQLTLKLLRPHPLRLQLLLQPVYLTPETLHLELYVLRFVIHELVDLQRQGVYRFYVLADF